MSNLTLPSRNNMGAPLLLDPEVQEMVDVLHNGYPPLGWEGDERLGLYHTEEGRWELDRLCEDGVLRTVCRSAVGQRLDMRLILMLVEHDARRGHDAASEVIDHNEALGERREKEAVDALAVPMEKVLWGMVKDLGHLY